MMWLVGLCCMCVRACVLFFFLKGCAICFVLFFQLIPTTDTDLPLMIQNMTDNFDFLH